MTGLAGHASQLKRRDRVPAVLRRIFLAVCLGLLLPLLPCPLRAQEKIVVSYDGHMELDQFYDESVIDELEREGFFKKLTGKDSGR